MLVIDYNNLPEHIFIGKPCKRCGGTLRYAMKPSCRCVYCKHLANKKRYIKEETTNE